MAQARTWDDGQVAILEGVLGTVRGFVDELPSPFDCNSETLADLPVHDEE